MNVKSNRNETHRVGDLSTSGLSFVLDVDPFEAVLGGIVPTESLLTQGDDEVARLINYATCSEPYVSRK